MDVLGLRRILGEVRESGVGAGDKRVARHVDPTVAVQLTSRDLSLNLSLRESVEIPMLIRVVDPPEGPLVSPPPPATDGAVTLL